MRSHGATQKLMRGIAKTRAGSELVSPRLSYGQGPELLSCAENLLGGSKGLPVLTRPGRLQLSRGQRSWHQLETSYEHYNKAYKSPRVFKKHHLDLAVFK